MLDALSCLTGPASVQQFSVAPHLSLNGTMQYRNGPLQMTLQARYIDDGVYDRELCGPGGDNYCDPGLFPFGYEGRTMTSAVHPETGATINPHTATVNNNAVPDYLTWNLSASYMLYQRDRRSFELFGNIQNLFDKDPPITPSGQSAGGGGNGTPVNGILFDTLGRRYRIGLRASY